MIERLFRHQLLCAVTVTDGCQVADCYCHTLTAPQMAYEYLLRYMTWWQCRIITSCWCLSY